VPVSIQEGALYGNCSVGRPGRVYTAADDKQVTVLISLDLSAAFNTVDHEVVLQRLQSEFDVTAILLTWIHFYLEGRTSMSS